MVVILRCVSKDDNARVIVLMYVLVAQSFESGLHVKQGTEFKAQRHRPPIAALANGKLGLLLVRCGR